MGDEDVIGLRFVGGDGGRDAPLGDVVEVAARSGRALVQVGARALGGATAGQRVRLINENMIGKIVRIEGVVERVHFQFLNRPQYTVGDRSGSISVKMFTTPEEDVKVNDIVEVLGQVIKRYIVTGEPVINAVVIRKTGQNAKEK